MALPWDSKRARTSGSSSTSRTAWLSLATMAGVRARFESQGNAIRIETPEQFKKTVHNDRLKWAQVVKDAKISID